VKATARYPLGLDAGTGGGSSGDEDEAVRRQSINRLSSASMSWAVGAVSGSGLRGDKGCAGFSDSLRTNRGFGECRGCGGGGGACIGDARGGNGMDGGRDTDCTVSCGTAVGSGDGGGGGGGGGRASVIIGEGGCGSGE